MYTLFCIIGAILCVVFRLEILLPVLLTFIAYKKGLFNSDCPPFLKGVNNDDAEE